MPHQCLKCGKIFEEGSSELLKGCTVCGGNRFFFTKKPLSEEGRKLKTEEVKKDVNQALMELINSDDNEIVDKSGKWLNLKPKDLRKAFENQKDNITPINCRKNAEKFSVEKFRENIRKFVEIKMGEYFKI